MRSRAVGYHEELTRAVEALVPSALRPKPVPIEGVDPSSLGLLFRWTPGIGRFKRKLVTMVDLPAMSEETERQFAREVVMMGEQYRLDAMRLPPPADMDVLTFEGAPSHEPVVRVMTMDNSTLAERVWPNRRAIPLHRRPTRWTPQLNTSLSANKVARTQLSMMPLLPELNRKRISVPGEDCGCTCLPHSIC